MQYRRLGTSLLEVSDICLGTMTWGEQNTEAEAHAQLDLATERGINFIDAAEMYPVPARAETSGRTEAYLGSWLARQRRDRFIVATKLAAPSRGLTWLRDGKSLTMEPAQIRGAVENSLRRLQTEYIDLYQIHWPARRVPMFGGTQYEPDDELPSTPIREQLESLGALVREGKIRYLGVSNETPWGVCQFTRLAEEYGLPRIVSIQNAYSLVNRTFESGLAEACHREKVGLLAYSPMAFGVLSGKYLEHADTDGRLSKFPAFGGRYRKPGVEEAVRAYADIARQHGLTPAVLALAFVRQRWFVASTIIGATNLAQLEENLSSAAVTLSDDVLAEIEAVHARYTNPAP